MRLRRLAVAALPVLLLAACSSDMPTGPEQTHGPARRAAAPQLGSGALYDPSGSNVMAAPQLGSGALYDPTMTSTIEGSDGTTAAPQLGSGALFEPVVDGQ